MGGPISRITKSKMANGGHLVKNQTGWHNSGSTQDRDMMSSSVVGLSGAADLMVKVSVSENARWRPAAILDILK